jgi:hypothetical protein
MLTGQMLYAEENQLKLLDQVREANNPRPSQLREGVPEELEAIAMKALSPDQGKRFQTAYEFQRSLTEYLHRKCVGFTPQRVARLMWDLFQEEGEAAGAAPPPGTALNQQEFSKSASHDSIILSPTAAEALRLSSISPPPATRGPDAPTREVRSPSQPSPSSGPPRSREGRGLIGGVHPPPPIAREGEDSFDDPTQVADWDGFAALHADRNLGLFEDAPSSDLNTSAPPLPEQFNGFDQDGPTSLYDPAFIRAARAGARGDAAPLRATPSPVPAPLPRPSPLPKPPLAPIRRLAVDAPARRIGPKPINPAVERKSGREEHRTPLPDPPRREPEEDTSSAISLELDDLVSYDPEPDPAIGPGHERRDSEGHASVPVVSSFAEETTPPTVVGDIPAEIMGLDAAEESAGSSVMGVLTSRAVIAVAIVCLLVVVLGCLGVGAMVLTSSP